MILLVAIVTICYPFQFYVVFFKIYKHHRKELFKNINIFSLDGN